jgi:hypothetical protein
MGAVGVIGETTADQARLEELEHRETGHVTFQDLDDLGFTQPLHSDQVAQAQHVLADPQATTDHARIAVLQVDAARHRPAAREPDPLRCLGGTHGQCVAHVGSLRAARG